MIKLMREDMNIEVREMPELKLAYTRYTGPYGSEGMKAVFEKTVEWGISKGLLDTGKVVGIYLDDPSHVDASDCRTDVCITISQDIELDGCMKLQTIPAGLYAVYHCEVADGNFEEPWNDIFEEWLPVSEYEFANAPCYELYHSCSEDNCVVDICVPVKAKQA